MPNGINETSPDIRDFLLNRNLILSDTITNNSLDGLGVGLGKESSIGTFPEVVRASEDIETSNPNYRNSQIQKNHYISTEQMVSATIIDNSFSYKQLEGGYIDNNKKLNIGGPSTQPYDVVGSILNGDGFGLTSKGLDPQFDIRASLAGRVLGATGVIEDTPLGIIAGQQMLLALGQRNLFNIQKELNLNPIGLIKGQSLINKNWSITIEDKDSQTLVGKVFDSALHLSGFEKPKSVINSSVSILNKGYSFGLLKSTGKGQLEGLYSNLNALNYKGSTSKRYKPNYEDDSELFGYLENKDGAKVVSRDERLINPDGKDFIWGQETDIPITNTNSLLYKTKNLFGGNYKLTESLFGTRPTLETNKEIGTPGYGNTISRGSGVIGGDYAINRNPDDIEDGQRIFCRTWTSQVGYNTVDALQKHSGLVEGSTNIRNNTSSSVLGSNGFVKVSPYKRPDSVKNVDDAKKYMFSIENLAWADNLDMLPEIEIGSGDKTTGTKGRIMWFPPYDIEFSESTSVNLDTTNFIGRGEPIYTYNNTERTGSLSFKVIIDYPDYLNNPNIDTDTVISSIASGCLDYDKFFSVNEKAKIQEKQHIPNKAIKVDREIGPDNFNIYFPNDVWGMLRYNDYELYGNEYLPTLSPNQNIVAENGNESEDRLDFGLNRYWNLDIEAFKLSIIEELTEKCNSCDIQVRGFASKAGTTEANDVLSKKRGDDVKEWLESFLGSIEGFDVNRIKVLLQAGDSEATAPILPYDSIDAKRDRFVNVIFVPIDTKNEQAEEVSETKKESTANIELSKDIRARFHNEGEYFEELKNSDTDSDKIIYDTIRQKIKYFQPAFHSTTPEGFNSRLTFLQQCTRQGPTEKNNGAQNLAFGAPPVCILRVGDFYNTKIIIDNLSMDFSPLVWDLNPEGVGVQPMIAKVTIQFKFIGGSSLKGPINQLQNAISFNYYGNTEIYDPRAKTIIPNSDPEGLSTVSELPDGFTLKIDSDKGMYSKYDGKTLASDLKDAAEKANAKSEVEPPVGVPKILGFDNISGTSTYVDTISYVKPENSIIINLAGSDIEIGESSYVDTFNTSISFVSQTENIIGNEDDSFYQYFLGKGFKVTLSKIISSTESKVVKSIVFLTAAEIKLALLSGFGFNVTNIEEGSYELKLDNKRSKLDVYQFIINKDNTTIDYLKIN